MKPQEFLKENEFIGDDAHQMHQSHQHHMLREECYHSAANAIKLHQLLGQLPEGHELDAWAAEKISLANDYLKTVTEWLEYDVMGGTNEAMMSGGIEAFSMESVEKQYEDLLGENNAGSFASVPAVGGGTLFGGSYSNPDSPFKNKKKSVKKETVIKR